jgi:hypothetical protein
MKSSAWVSNTRLPSSLVEVMAPVCQPATAGNPKPAAAWHETLVAAAPTRPAGSAGITRALRYKDFIPHPLGKPKLTLQNS